jgi:hypothetical protein
MLNENTFLIEKLRHDLTQDIEQWLSFSDLSEEEQNEICENIASKEYENHDDDDLAGNQFIYEEASEKMGYIRESSLQDDEKNLHYNLSYSQGDYTYLMGSYNLHTLLKNNGASKQLLKDLNYLLKMSITIWEQSASDSDLYSFIDTKNKCFCVSREEDRRHYEKTNLEEFIDALKSFSLASGGNPVCVKRIMNELTATSGGGFNRASQNLIETAFENYEYNLKRQLYDDMEAIEESNKEHWIKEVLKPELKGKYNRATKHFIRDTTKTYYIN